MPTSVGFQCCLQLSLNNGCATHFLNSIQKLWAAIDLPRTMCFVTLKLVECQALRSQKLKRQKSNQFLPLGSLEEPGICQQDAGQCLNPPELRKNFPPSLM